MTELEKQQLSMAEKSRIEEERRVANSIKNIAMTEGYAEIKKWINKIKEAYLMRTTGADIGEVKTEQRTNGKQIINIIMIEKDTYKIGAEFCNKLLAKLTEWEGR